MAVTRGQKRKRERETKQALPLPEEMFTEVAKHLGDSEQFAFAMACRGFRDALGVLKRPFKTNFMRLVSAKTPLTREWIKWAFQQSDPSSGQEQRYRFLREQDFDKSRRLELSGMAAFHGYEDELVWMKEQGCTFVLYTLDMAAQGGQLDVLKWLVEEGSNLKCDAGTFRAAALGGNVAVLKWLKKSQNCAWDQASCFAAASRGNLDALKWLRSGRKKCPWDERTCASAAYAGNLELLKWARSKKVCHVTFYFYSVLCAVT
jgi:hypothetical protein